MNTFLNMFLSVIFLLSLSGCAPHNTLLPQESMVTSVPIPFENNEGKYMSPYTSDGVLAEWVNNTINGEVGAALGATTGALLGQQVSGDIPIAGAWVGSSLGSSIGQNMAFEAAGGVEFIKQTSDISFNDLKSLTIYLYVNYSETEHYQAAIKATQAIYPELKAKYQQYVSAASAVSGY